MAQQVKNHSPIQFLINLVTTQKNLCLDSLEHLPRQDFERPNNSDILRALERFQDERIQSAATLFKSLLYLEPQQVPPLDGQLAPLPSPPEMALPIWLKDYVKPKPTEDASGGQPIVPEPSS